MLIEKEKLRSKGMEIVSFIFEEKDDYDLVRLRTMYDDFCRILISIKGKFVEINDL